MGLSAIVSKVDASIGRVVSDKAGAAPPDLNFKVPAATYERIKDGLIDAQTAIGLADGTTSGSIEQRLLRGVPLATPSIKTANYTLAVTDNVVRVNSSGGVFNLTLPTSPPTGWHFRVKDVNGSCGTLAVTLVRAGSEKIENVAANFALAANYGSWHFWFDGTDYWLLG
jgi:hypothetical protein